MTEHQLELHVYLKFTRTPYGFLGKEVLLNSLTYSYLTLMHSFSKDWQNSEIPFRVCFPIISLSSRAHTGSPYRL